MVWTSPLSVIPAKAGNQGNDMHVARLDSGFRRNDDFLFIAKMNSLQKGMMKTQKEPNVQADYDAPPNSGIFLDSAHFAPESILPAQFLAYEHERDDEPPRPLKTMEPLDEEDEEKSSKIGLIASVSVGIIIAFALFLVIRYAERSTRSYVTESWVSEVSRRVGQYEQIYGTLHPAPNHEEMLPYNLALHSWQEIHLEKMTADIPCPCFSTHVESHEAMCSHFGMISSDVLCHSALESLTGISDHILLLMPGREISVRLGFGQDLLFRDGRIFSRILPGVERP
ncbi:MAG: hypothetical protein FWG73_00690 [Planctomycetaceae bacterium]|nr:hypothetical protein [Planctomycetaceae bacterium]